MKVKAIKADLQKARHLIWLQFQRATNDSTAAEMRARNFSFPNPYYTLTEPILKQAMEDVTQGL